MIDISLEEDNSGKDMSVKPLNLSLEGGRPVRINLLYNQLD